MIGSRRPTMSVDEYLPNTASKANTSYSNQLSRQTATTRSKMQEQTTASDVATGDPNRLSLRTIATIVKRTTSRQQRPKAPSNLDTLDSNHEDKRPPSISSSPQVSSFKGEEEEEEEEDSSRPPPPQSSADDTMNDQRRPPRSPSSRPTRPQEQKQSSPQLKRRRFLRSRHEADKPKKVSAAAASFLTPNRPKRQLSGDGGDDSKQKTTTPRGRSFGLLFRGHRQQQRQQRLNTVDETRASHPPPTGEVVKSEKSEEIVCTNMEQVTAQHSKVTDPSPKPPSNEPSPTVQDHIVSLSDSSISSWTSLNASTRDAGVSVAFSHLPGSESSDDDEEDVASFIRNVRKEFGLQREHEARDDPSKVQRSVSQGQTSSSKTGASNTNLEKILLNITKSFSKVGEKTEDDKSETVDTNTKIEPVKEHNGSAGSSPSTTNTEATSRASEAAETSPVLPGTVSLPSSTPDVDKIRVPVSLKQSKSLDLIQRVPLNKSTSSSKSLKSIKSTTSGKSSHSKCNKSSTSAPVRKDAETESLSSKAQRLVAGLSGGAALATTTELSNPTIEAVHGKTERTTDQAQDALPLQDVDSDRNDVETQEPTEHPSSDEPTVQSTGSMQERSGEPQHTKRTTDTPLGPSAARNGSSIVKLQHSKTPPRSNKRNTTSARTGDGSKIDSDEKPSNTEPPTIRNRPKHELQSLRNESMSLLVDDRYEEDSILDIITETTIQSPDTSVTRTLANESPVSTDRGQTPDIEESRHERHFARDICSGSPAEQGCDSVLNVAGTTTVIAGDLLYHACNEFGMNGSRDEANYKSDRHVMISKSYSSESDVSNGNALPRVVSYSAENYGNPKIKDAEDSGSVSKGKQPSNVQVDNLQENSKGENPIGSKPKTKGAFTKTFSYPARTQSEPTPDESRVADDAKTTEECKHNEYEEHSGSLLERHALLQRDSITEILMDTAEGLFMDVFGMKTPESMLPDETFFDGMHCTTGTIRDTVQFTTCSGNLGTIPEEKEEEDVIHEPTMTSTPLKQGGSVSMKHTRRVPKTLVTRYAEEKKVDQEDEDDDDNAFSDAPSFGESTIIEKGSKQSYSDASSLESKGIMSRLSAIFCHSC